MKVYLLPGMLGLLTGLLLHRTRLDRQDELQASLSLRRTLALRSGLTALGWAMVMTALLCWLAVIDVDTITLVPLSLGAILGGGLFGIAAALCGYTPTTAFAGLTLRPLEALCFLLGCGGMTLLQPVFRSLTSPLQTAAPYLAATLFRVTLDEPFLLSGGFLGLGCLGAVLITVALCIPNPAAVAVPQPAAVPQPTEPAESADLPEEESSEAEPDEPVESPEPDEPDLSDPPEVEAAEQTLIALLPGEEPLVVDTALEEDGENPDPDLAPEPKV